MTVQTPTVASFVDKGGCAKTTNAAHISAAAAIELGHDVLAVDLAGKQGDLCKHFGVWTEVQNAIDTEEDWPNITTTFSEDWSHIVKQLGDDVLEELIYQTDLGVDVLPAHPGLDGLDEDLGNIDDAEERYSRFEAFLSEFVDPLDYDLIVVDLPGATNNVSYNGLYACRKVLTPTLPGRFEAEQVAALQDDLARFSNLYAPVDIVMLTVNRVQAARNLTQKYQSRYSEDYPEILAPAPIVDTEDIGKAQDAGQTLFDFPLTTTTGPRAREAFVENTRELLTRIN